MKKFLLSALVVFLSSTLYALGPNMWAEVSRTARRPDNYSSEAVYQSSTTCVATNLSTVWVSSPITGSLYSIDVTSAGSANSVIRVFDGTSATATARLVTSYISGAIRNQYFYNVSFSSMIAVDLQTIDGAIPCVDIIYRVR